MRRNSSRSLNSNHNKSNAAMLMKFSTSSVTSARAKHQKEQQQQSITDLNNGLNIGIGINRRKYFNTSTEFVHIVSLILMSFCRRVLSQTQLKRRLIAYTGLVLIGGLLNDFAPVLIRALMFSLSSSNLVNKIFVKFGWLWNTLSLLPLIVLTSHLIRSFETIDFNQIEKLIDNVYYGSVSGDRQQTSTSSSSVKALNFSSSSPVNLSQSFSNSFLNDYQTKSKNNTIWSKLFSMFNLIRIKDVFRFIICSSVYFGSVLVFRLIHSITMASRHYSSSRSSVNNEMTVANTINEIRSGLDISGHIYLLVFSNLIFIEECSIMIGWEALGDRLYSLSTEFKNFKLNSFTETSSSSTPIASSLSTSSSSKNMNEILLSFDKSNDQFLATETNRRLLVLASNRYHNNAVLLRSTFLLCTALSLLWDFMLVQTALFYHSLIEKLLALVWALVCWYGVYRFLFPLINLEVRRTPITNVTTSTN